MIYVVVVSNENNAEVERYLVHTDCASLAAEKALYRCRQKYTCDILRVTKVYELSGEFIDDTTIEDKLSEIKNKIIETAIDGLATDGEHHKQWYLEQILILCGEDLEKLHKAWIKDGCDTELGIAP